MAPDAENELSRSDVDRLPGPVLLEFGAHWCPHCQSLAPKLERLLEGFPEVQHVKIEDGPGKPLGRSFRVKLWPNLVFLKDGEVVQQLARPGMDEVRAGLESITERP